MKLVGAAILVCVTIIARAASESKGSVNIPVTQLRYVSTGVTDGVTGEVKAAPAYGDFAHGAHGTFLKMPAGFATPIHSHTDDYYGVVISGVGVNVAVGGTEIPLPAGSYWFQKGGERHITKCISSNECIFFISQSTKFDFIPDTVNK
jgi:hypothetical protein